VIRLEKILQELLDFAKPIRLNARKESLNEVLLSSIELLEMKLESENIILNKDLDPTIPLMHIDGQLLVQAVLNLLINAVEASTAGQTIYLRSQYDKELGEMVEIMVSDQGPGIPDNIMMEIFKPFFTTKVRGTGLGLNNVKRIAEAHMGRVEVRKIFPRGACFTIQIPVQ
jgi:signal transduction histidine kinase